MLTRLLALALLIVPTAAFSAPPTLTHLYPAGGRQGTSVTVTLSGTFSRWPVRAWVDGKGVVAKAGKAKGQLMLTIAANATPGPRWLRIHDRDGASVPRRFIVGTLPEVNEKEPNNDTNKAQSISGNVVVNGRLAKAGDVDCFSVKLKKGQTLVASVLANRVLGSPMDGVVQVVSEKGFVLAQNNDHAGLDPQVTYTATDDGPHIVRVFAFPSVPDASVRFAGGERFIYRMTITTGPFIEHAWPLAIQRGKGMTVGLVGSNLTEKTRKADVVEIDGDQGIAASKDMGGFGEVRIEPHPCVLRQSGAKAQKITVPVTVSGHLEKSGQTHIYEIDGRKGQRLEIQIESALAGFALDGVVRLLDKSGKTLGQTQSRVLNRDPALLRVTLPRDETYRIEVSDQQGVAGPRHLYRLRVMPAEPDFALSVATDRFSLTPGKPVDVPVTLARRNGFAAAVTLEAEGLPAGVSAEMVTPKKGSTTLTLRLRADAKAAGGVAFRIIGKTKGGQRVARAVLTDPPEAIERLWLNVASASKK